MFNNWFILIFLAFLIISCSQNAEQIKYQQYVISGKRLYMSHCQNCHQQDGTGVGQLIPPLVGGDFSPNITQVACLIRYGNQGMLTTNPDQFLGKMPSNTVLTPLEIANILTYIDNQWGAKAFVSIDQVNVALEKCQVED